MARDFTGVRNGKPPQSKAGANHPLSALDTLSNCDQRSRSV